MEKSLSQDPPHQGSNKKITATHTESEPPSPATRRNRGQKAKRHCGRFWWIYAILLALIILLVALLVVYVGVPHLAQHDVNRSSLTFNAIQYLNPTENSVVINQTATLHNPNTYTPTLDPFNASLYLVTDGERGPEPLLQIAIPKVHSTKPDAIVHVTQNVTFASLDQVTAYTVAVINSEEVTTQLIGKTKLHLGSLPTVGIHYKPMTTSKGLNKLQGFNVTGVKINPLATTGNNLMGFAYIPNPSVLTIQMGNVTLDVSTAKAGNIGNVTIPNMTLVPGNNTLPMAGFLNQTLVLGSSVQGMLDLIITGNSSVYNGQHLTYYEKALQSLPLSLTLNITQILMDSLKQ